MHYENQQVDTIKLQLYSTWLKTLLKLASNLEPLTERGNLGTTTACERFLYEGKKPNPRTVPPLEISINRDKLTGGHTVSQSANWTQ
jgi:hypothetical protein